MKKLGILPLLTAIVLGIAACGGDSGSQSTPTTAAASPTATPRADCRMLQPGDEPAPPCGALDTSKSYTAEFETEKGSFTVELFDDTAPLAVENFVNLARIGFYDGVTFHRVIPGFVAQAGDPTGTGGGGPGYRFPDQFDPAMKHDSAGILSMANAGANTNGSQFFITYAPEPHLDPYDADGNMKACASPAVSCHMVFGKVTSGMEVVNSISPRDPATAAAPGDEIITIKISES